MLFSSRVATLSDDVAFVYKLIFNQFECCWLLSIDEMHKRRNLFANQIDEFLIKKNILSILWTTRDCVGGWFVGWSDARLWMAVWLAGVLIALPFAFFRFRCVTTVGFWAIESISD